MAQKDEEHESLQGVSCEKCQFWMNLGPMLTLSLTLEMNDIFFISPIYNNQITFFANSKMTSIE